MPERHRRNLSSLLEGEKLLIQVLQVLRTLFDCFQIVISVKTEVGGSFQLDNIGNELKCPLLTGAYERYAGIRNMVDIKQHKQPLYFSVFTLTKVITHCFFVL